MRKITLFFFLLGMPAAVSARFKGGFYIGANGSQVDGDNFVGYYKLGLNIGATAMYPLSKSFDVAMEILYSQKGSQSKMIEGYPQQLFFKLDYIEVPLLINYRSSPEINKANQGKDLDKVTLTAGVSVARLVYDTLVTYQIPFGQQNLPQVRSLNKTDYDVVLGGAYQLTDRIQINIRYNYSMAQMGASANSRSRNQGMFNNVISFRIGYIVKGRAK